MSDTDKSGNKRNRSPEAEARRVSRNIVMDFTGWGGLVRSLVNYKPATVFQKKPKRGWAARRRKAPFKEFFADDPVKLEKARMRHAWRRKEKFYELLRQKLAAE